ncbi:MAG: hypothetical protein WCX71_01865 [Candidatus Buchananbacteria bacterium]
MKKSFKALVIVCLIVMGLSCSSSLILAAGETTGGSQLNLTDKMEKVGTAAGFGTTPITITIGQIIQIFLSLLGVIFLGYTIYAGFLWLTSAGNDEKLTKAKSILRGSIIGIIIILGAYAITAFVISQAGEATGYQVGESNTTESSTSSQ